MIFQPFFRNSQVYNFRNSEFNSNNFIGTVLLKRVGEKIEFQKSIQDCVFEAVLLS